MRYALQTALLLLLGSTWAAANPMDLDVFETFETINTSPGETFTIGTDPGTAEFGGNAFAGIAFIPELYFSGNHAWMVNPGGTGTVQFLSGASAVQFWARTRSSANGTTTITAFDPLDQIVGAAVTLSPPAGFQLVSFDGNIDRIEVVNSATGSSQMNSVDDFGFTPLRLGDMDLDDDVDFDDIDPFVLGLTNAGAYQQTFGVPSFLHGDTDRDGDHDFDDIDSFVARLMGGTTLRSVPEPAGLLLAVFGLLAAPLLARRSVL